MAVDRAGNVVIADTSNARVRVVAVKTGTFYGKAMTAGDIYKVAGNGLTGSFSNGTRAARAPLGAVYGVAVDGAGNVLIATGENQIVVVAATTGTFYGKAMTAGDIYKVAGDGAAGFSGDGGPAAKAELDVPNGVTVDGAGNLLIADTQNNRVRVVAAKTGTFYGHPMTAGDIYTIAGDATRGFSGDGGPATAAELSWPGGVSVDGSGNVVIADTSNQRVRVVALSSGTFYGQAVTAGDITTVAGDGTFGKASGNGGPAASAQLSGPRGVAAGGTGTIISDTADNQVRVVAAATGTFYGQPMTAGNIYAIAGNGIAWYSGDGGPGTAAELDKPTGVAADGAGNVLIADAGNNRIRVVAAATGTFYGQPMTAGSIYTIAGNGSYGYSGDGGPATRAELNHPVDVTVDAAGNVVIADEYNDRIRVVAAATGTFYGQAMTAGSIYTIAGNGSYGYSGDGGPATSAAMRQPQGVAADGAGNLLIADTSNYRIRVVAAATGTFYGQPMTIGDIYTIAGNGSYGYSGDGASATSAQLNNPVGVVADAAGNLLIADSSNNRIRVAAATTGTFYGRAMTAGDIYTAAGDGTAGFSGDGGPASNAELSDPIGVAINNAGTLLIADEGNNRIRAVTG